MLRADFCVYNAAQLVTMDASGAESDGSALGVVTDGALCARDGSIVWVGPTHAVTREIELDTDATVIDATGKVVLPGFVDSHTHPVFAGERSGEFYERALKGTGASSSVYAAQLEQGRGIMTTVRATRAASEDDLYALARARADDFLRCGTTTIEAKSGYGLDVDTELRSLRVLQRLDREHPLNVAPTFLGPHAVPEEYVGRPEEFIDLMIADVLPQAAELATFADVWCEDVAFSYEASRRFLTAARRHGMLLKLHGDELGPSGGGRLAAELAVLSADHLVYTPQPDMWRMAEAGVVAVLLPGTSFFLGGQHYAPARTFLEAGVEIALATDFNPGTSPTQQMQFILTLAVQHLHLTAQEALRAATVGGARAAGVADRAGILAVGRPCDLAVMRVPDYRLIPYYFAMNLVDVVAVRGRVVVSAGEVIAHQPEMTRAGLV